MKDTKKPAVVLSVLLVLVLVATMLGCGEPEPEIIVLKFSSHAPASWPGSIEEIRWCDDVVDRTNGQVQFEYYWDGILLGGADAVKGVGDGIADLAHAALGYAPGLTPLATGFELSYQTEDSWAAANAMYEMYRTFTPLIEEADLNNIVMLDFMGAKTIIAYRNNEVNTLEELRQLKIRVYGGVATTLTALGATPVGIPAGETYESIQRNVVQGHSGQVISYTDSAGLYEVAPYITDPGFGVYAVSGIIMNKDVYEGLPADIRKAIDDVTEEAVKYWHTPMTMATELEILEKWHSDPNVHIYKMSDAEKKRWRDIAVPGIWEEWLKEKTDMGLPAQEFLDRYHELLRKYEAISPYKSWTYISE